MDHPQSEIRRQIESTRTEMVEKISTLTERLDGAIEEMKHLVNLKYQAEQRPWLMMGISTVAGYLLSRLVRAGSRKAIVNWPDNGMNRRVALGRQSAGFIGGIVSAVVVALARDYAMSLLTKRASHMPDHSDGSGQTTRRTLRPVFDRSQP